MNSKQKQTASYQKNLNLYDKFLIKMANSPFPQIEPLFQKIAKQIQADSFSILPANVLQSHYNFTQTEVKQFTDSWNNLSLDKYMNDGGKYRYRRHSVFTYNFADDTIINTPGIPHYQNKKNNYLNGGVERYFEPITEEIITNRVFVNLINLCLKTFASIKVSLRSLYIEAHQFRIITNSEILGLPTPEGIHKDGVTYVFIMLINRVNVVGGESHLYDNQKKHLLSYFLENTLDCTFLDDAKLMHSVSSIQACLDSQTGYRDTLVITFTEI